MGDWLSAAELLFAAVAINASVGGVVRDSENGEPIAGATVSLTELDRSVATDVEGRYIFHAVPAGPQQLTVRRMGYATRTLHALVPSWGSLEISVALRPEPITLRVVEVRPAVPVRGLDSSGSTTQRERGLSLDEIRNDPLLPEPDVLQALNGGEAELRAESPSGVHVRGGASDQTTYLLDGIPVYSPYHTAGTVSAWNPDALARVELNASATPPDFPDALSGAVSASTITAGSRLRTQGAISTTQARVTVAGPLGRAGTGYLLSARSTFPGFVASKREPSYLRGEGRDWLAKLEVPFARGHVRLLGYGSTSEIDAASSARSDVEPSAGAEIDPDRNAFAWQSRSLGARWTRQFQNATLQLRAWNAVGLATALWRPHGSTPERLATEHRDDGLVAMVEVAHGASRSEAGIRAERLRSYYRVRPLSDDRSSTALSSGTPVWAAFVQHTRKWRANTELAVGVVGAIAEGDVHLGPRAQLRWSPSRATEITAAYDRHHQFAQSLRNEESVVGAIFPADLYVSAGGAGVPVARSDQGTIDLEYRPTPRLRLGVHAWVRNFAGLTLAAPRADGPFASRDFAIGSGGARGLSVEANASGLRYEAVASYGVRRVRLRYGDSTFVPGHGATHTIDAGLMVLPSATFSIRLGTTVVLGRRATAAEGPLEWESCNLADRGCELAGSPWRRVEPLGATRLPAYIRVDLGLRKQWRIEHAGRYGLVAVFGTVTNIFGRRNVLTPIADPTTGERTEIEMRPRAPLVVGIDWRY